MVTGWRLGEDEIDGRLFMVVEVEARSERQPLHPFETLISSLISSASDYLGSFVGMTMLYGFKYN